MPAIEPRSRYSFQRVNDVEREGNNVSATHALQIARLNYYKRYAEMLALTFRGTITTLTRLICSKQQAGNLKKIFLHNNPASREEP